MNTRLSIIIVAVTVGVAAAAAAAVGWALVAQQADMQDCNIVQESGPASEPRSSDVTGFVDNKTDAEALLDANTVPSAMEMAAAGVVEITTRKQLIELVRTTQAVYPDRPFWALGAAPAAQTETDPRVTDYAANAQVTGIDELDYLKNDDRYAYIAVGSTLIIADVWPASEMHTVTKVDLAITPNEIDNMLLGDNGDKLVVFYTAESDDPVEGSFDLGRFQSPTTHAVVIDVSDRESPEILTDYAIDGWFEDAHMMGDRVYVVTTDPLNDDRLDFPTIMESGTETVPRAFYFEDDWRLSTFTTISAIDVSGDGDGASAIISKTYLMGETGAHYVTPSNLYLTYVKSFPPYYYHEQSTREIIRGTLPLLPAVVQEQIRDQIDPPGWLTMDEPPWAGPATTILTDYFNSLDTDERDRFMTDVENAIGPRNSDILKSKFQTVIHKVSIDDGSIEYLARGEMPGILLNRFSIDEDNGGERLRVSTTLEHLGVFGGPARSNSVYTLDAGLEMVGSLEGVAPDELTYVTRFMGERLYMGAFQHADPFFVIDISSDAPRMLGELKISGIPHYLHPYDDRHVIWVGRDAPLDDVPGVRDLGLKVALFDVSDVSNPTVAGEIVIGDASTYSGMLLDHKVFSFDGRRNMISIPVDGPYPGLAGTLDPYEQDNTFKDAIHPTPYWSGFYILDVEPQDCISIRGAVSHSAVSSGGSYVDPRTFYIENVLYSAADDALIASDIDSLERLGFVRLLGNGMLID